MATYRFGDFHLDSATGELRRTGHRIRIRPQPCMALIYLLDHQGQLVGRRELHAALWPPGTYVHFDQGLNSCIKQIRAALGDTRTRPRFLETLSRRGYRFIAPVSRHDSASAGERQRIVLLRFVSLSPGEALTAALAAGIEEEVAVDLARPDSRSFVVTRFSGSEDAWFDDGRQPVERTGDYLLGAAVRCEAGAFRLTAHLVSAADRSLVWVETFDGTVDGLIHAQTAIAARLSSSVCGYLQQRVVSVPSSTTQIVAADMRLRGVVPLSTERAQKMVK